MCVFITKRFGSRWGIRAQGVAAPVPTPRGADQRRPRTRRTVPGHRDVDVTQRQRAAGSAGVSPWLARSGKRGVTWRLPVTSVCGHIQLLQPKILPFLQLCDPAAFRTVTTLRLLCFLSCLFHLISSFSAPALMNRAPFRETMKTPPSGPHGEACVGEAWPGNPRLNPRSIRCSSRSNSFEAARENRLVAKATTTTQTD